MDIMSAFEKTAESIRDWVNKKTPNKLTVDENNMLYLSNDNGIISEGIKLTEGGGTDYNDFATVPKMTTVSIPAANWTGDTAPYSQVITVNGVTANSKIDLQPTAAQILELQETDIMLMAENDNGTVTIYALGGIPTSDYTMQVLITEVEIV